LVSYPGLELIFASNTTALSYPGLALIFSSYGGSFCGSSGGFIEGASYCYSLPIAALILLQKTLIRTAIIINGRKTPNTTPATSGLFNGVPGLTLSYSKA